MTPIPIKVRLHGVTKKQMEIIFLCGAFAPAYILAYWGYIHGSIGWVLALAFVSGLQSFDFELDEEKP